MVIQFPQRKLVKLISVIAQLRAVGRAVRAGRRAVGHAVTCALLRAVCLRLCLRADRRAVGRAVTRNSASARTQLILTIKLLFNTMTSAAKVVEKSPVVLYVGGHASGCVVIDVVVQGAPINLKEITFRNYYTALVTIKARIRETAANGR